MKLRNLLSACALSVAVFASAEAPNYIFYFIGDGMGLGPVMAAQTYKRLTDNTALTMTQFPIASWAMTYSASSPVTDSAAAGTALSTGSKTNNGMVGMNADTVAVYSIANALKADGYGIGLVTNCAPDDATPAAFYAHQPKRSMFYEIGKDAAASGVDFLAGAGLRGATDKEGNANDLYDIIEQAGVQVLRGASGAKEVATSASKRIFLLNPLGVGDPNETGFVVDSTSYTQDRITLDIAFDTCLDFLKKNSPDSFFMMCEGGLIDHALHGNDGGAAVREIVAFDGTIAKAYEFYKQHPDQTLIVITADHDTGGMSTGCAATGYNAYPTNTDAQRISKQEFSDYCSMLLKTRMAFTWDDMVDYLRENLGIGTTVKLKDKVMDELKADFEDMFEKGRTIADEKGLYKTVNGFAAAVFKAWNDATGFGFTTRNHSGNPVPVFAVGVGAERFGRVLNNTEIAPTILSIAQGK